MGACVFLKDIADVKQLFDNQNSAEIGVAPAPHSTPIPTKR